MQSRFLSGQTTALYDFLSWFISFFIYSILAIIGLGLGSYARAKPLQSIMVSIEGRQLGGLTQGRFNRIEGDIDLPLQRPDQGKVRIKIDANSLQFPAQLLSDEVKKKDWLNATQFPFAEFESTSIQTKKPLTTLAGQTQDLNIEGMLYIKGIKKPIRFVAKWLAHPTQFQISGSFVFQRLDFGIGQGEWGDTQVVDNPVKVNFDASIAR